MKNLGIVFVLALPIACVPATPASPPAPLPALDPASVAWAADSGTATIEGQAFLKTRGGDVKYGAGNVVFLLPNVPYTFAWVTRAMSEPKNLPDLDPAVSKVLRKTTASGDGRFRFDGVPAGSYLALTTVTWGAAIGYRGSLVTQGGFVGAPVTAEAGKMANVIVTY